MLRLKLACLLPFTLCLTSPMLALGAGREDETVDFQKDVWPILERSCVQCHGPKESYSNLRLDSVERILKGGDLGKVLVPGEPENSPLYVRVSLPADDLDVMPVEGELLSEEEIDVIRRWIATGADFGGWTAAD